MKIRFLIGMGNVIAKFWASSVFFGFLERGYFIDGSIEASWRSPENTIFGLPGEFVLWAMLVASIFVFLDGALRFNKRTRALLERFQLFSFCVYLPVAILYIMTAGAYREVYEVLPFAVKSLTTRHAILSLVIMFCDMCTVNFKQLALAKKNVEVEYAQ